MVASRVFNVRWISGPTANALKFDARPDQSVRYSGEAVEIHRAVAKAHAPAHRRHRRGRK
jgi:alpha-D-xyloside xylohydrolase